jgi:hypothetical protein
MFLFEKILLRKIEKDEVKKSLHLILIHSSSFYLILGVFKTHYMYFWKSLFQSE